MRSGGLRIRMKLKTRCGYAANQRKKLRRKARRIAAADTKPELVQFRVEVG